VDDSDAAALGALSPIDESFTHVYCAASSSRPGRRGEAPCGVLRGGRLSLCFLRSLSS
jgi:hypothetical protein